ncbi:MAG: glycosyltransferase family 4 protein [Patescibacteria group bacterium]|nr:glycosyltransferase family 4 protein [Patescibacteria group bacterium]
MFKKVLISTLDPFNKGGVLSMVRFFYFRTKEEKLIPTLVYNIIPSLRDDRQIDDINLFDFLKLKKPIIKKEEIFNMRGYGLQRVLPEFEFLNYFLNIKLWKKIINDNYDLFFAIGGNNLVALPYVIFKKNFVLWVASTLYEDRIDRIKKEKFIRKLRDYASLPILLFLEGLIFKRANKILALSYYTRNKIINKYSFTKNKIETAFYPVDTNIFYPLENRKRKNNYILFTGRFTDERKNIILLLKAFLYIKENKKLNFDLKLKLVGDKPNFLVLDFIRKNNLENKVEILDFLPNDKLLKIYQNALLFVIPSFQEGLCISALEALACGVPVISTKCGGPEEFVIDDYNGYLVNNNDLNDLIEKILMFIKLDDSRKQQMGENARRYILENYSIEKIWPKFFQFFHEKHV